MAVDHYENFPVASFLLPHRFREPVAAIYVFARTADDFSDEGDLPAAERLEKLADFEAEINRLAHGEPSQNPIFQRLAPVVQQFGLPLQLFRDLLSAFRQDVVKDRYANDAELHDYCRRSADPVGRLLLHLFGQTDALSLARSDAICTALQLINHWQDVAIDLKKSAHGRIYLPQDALQRFGVTESALHAGHCDENFRQLLAFQVSTARQLMLQGAPLGYSLPGRCGLEIRAIVAGGLRILEKIEAVDYDVFRHRPQITAWDMPRLVWRTLYPPVPR